MKYTNLQIVNKCLEVINADEVTTIVGNERAESILSFLQDVYYELLSRIDTPHSQALETLELLVEPNNPTTFKYNADNTNFLKKIISFEYNVKTQADVQFRLIEYISPEEFLYKSNQLQSNFSFVTVDGNNQMFKVANNKEPEFYTTFDEKLLYLNSYNSDKDNGTLASNKTRVLSEKIPQFLLGDNDIPNLDDIYFPTLLRETQSMCWAVQKDGVNSKIEGSARRNRIATQNDRHKSDLENSRTNYGRKRSYHYGRN